MSWSMDAIPGNAVTIQVIGWKMFRRSAASRYSEELAYYRFICIPISLVLYVHRARALFVLQVEIFHFSISTYPMQSFESKVYRKPCCWHIYKLIHFEITYRLACKLCIYAIFLRVSAHFKLVPCFTQNLDYVCGI